MAKTLKAVFRLDNDKTATLSLADPKNGVTQAEVDTVANYIINNKALVYSGTSYPVSLKEAYIYETAKTPLA